MARTPKKTSAPAAEAIPLEQATIVDNWDVMGLKATGSIDYHCTDLYDPDENTYDVTTKSPVYGGAVYRNSASLSGLTFDVGLGTAFIKSSAHPFVNDASTTKQQVDASLGTVAIASETPRMAFAPSSDLSAVPSMSSTTVSAGMGWAMVLLSGRAGSSAAPRRGR